MSLSSSHGKACPPASTFSDVSESPSLLKRSASLSSPPLLRRTASRLFLHRRFSSLSRLFLPRRPPTLSAALSSPSSPSSVAAPLLAPSALPTTIPSAPSSNSAVASDFCATPSLLPSSSAHKPKASPSTPRSHILASAAIPLPGGPAYRLTSLPLPPNSPKSSASTFQFPILLPLAPVQSRISVDDYLIAATAEQLWDPVQQRELWVDEDEQADCESSFCVACCFTLFCPT